MLLRSLLRVSWMRPKISLTKDLAGHPAQAHLVDQKSPVIDSITGLFCMSIFVYGMY